MQDSNEGQNAATLRKVLRQALDDPGYPGVPQALGELEKLVECGDRLAAILARVGRELGVAHHAELHAESASALALWEEAR